jgi:hypothetical protein
MKYCGNINFTHYLLRLCLLNYFYKISHSPHALPHVVQHSIMALAKIDYGEVLHSERFVHTTLTMKYIGRTMKIALALSIRD